MSDCTFEDHLEEVDTGDGVIHLRPQPWMQWRQVGSVIAPSKAGSYGVNLASQGSSASGNTDVFGTLADLFGSLLGSMATIFGGSSLVSKTGATASAAGNKNDLLHSLKLGWTNNSPIDQWVYGLISRGGARVTLQARSRAGLVVRSGYAKSLGDAGPLTDSSMLAVGADIGRGGTMALGTSFCVMEERMNSCTFPLAPERTGWLRLAPGESIAAAVELRFISDFWENGTVDGGDAGSESSYETGDTRLDLFALPVIE